MPRHRGKKIETANFSKVILPDEDDTLAVSEEAKDFSSSKKKSDKASKGGKHGSHGAHAAPAGKKKSKGASKLSAEEEERFASFTSDDDSTEAIEGSSAKRPEISLPDVMLPVTLASPDAVTPAFEEVPKKKGRVKRVLKGIGLTLAGLIALAGVSYLGVSFFFTSHFMPNTSITSLNVSLMSRANAQDVINQELASYALSIEGEGFSSKVDVHEAGVDLNAEAVVSDALVAQDAWKWPLHIRESRDLSHVLAASYSKSAVSEKVKLDVDAFNETAEMPQDATLSYDSESKQFVVQPEVLGTALDANAVVELAGESLAHLERKATLTEEQLLKPAILSENAKLLAAKDKANEMLAADMVLYMGGTDVVHLDADIISDWVELSDEMEPSLNSDLMTEWIDQLASDCETVGTSRNYTRPDGKECGVSGGVYGWSIDYDALSELITTSVKEGAQGDFDIPCTSTGSVYNGPGEADWGTRFCDIDLAEQHVYFWDSDGSLIWESDCISGKPDGVHDTTTGVFVINSKSSPQKLIGYENGKKIYESNVQYWMPFDGNAIGLHDADWQPGFGGSMYANGYGSHGCVNLPPSKAAELYGLIETGDVVVCHW